MHNILGSTNNEELIGAIIVPQYLDRSDESLYWCAKCIIESDERMKFAYDLVLSQGGRKGIFQPKRRFIIDAYLSHLINYTVCANVIELHCSFVNGKNLYWRGTGSLKNMSSPEFAKQSRILGTSNDGDADVQVNINSIYPKLRQYLEFPQDFNT